MKNILIILIAIITGFHLVSCEELDKIAGSDETAAALKEALIFSTDTSVAKTSKINGYFGNAAIKIIFPKEAENIQKVLQLPGVSQLGQPLLDGLELKMNQAAEKAAPVARDIFVNAITNLTITDALNILGGDQDAATQYLRANANTLLYDAFYPEIDKAMTAVQADVAWNTVTNQYNTYSSDPIVSTAASIAGLNFKPIDTDISAYTTNKALDGLFIVIAEEEMKIRTDITHRVTDLLQRVFGK